MKDQLWLHLWFLSGRHEPGFLLCRALPLFQRLFSLLDPEDKLWLHAWSLSRRHEPGYLVRRLLSVLRVDSLFRNLLEVYMISAGW